MEFRTLDVITNLLVRFLIVWNAVTYVELLAIKPCPNPEE